MTSVAARWIRLKAEQYRFGLERRLWGTPEAWRARHPLRPPAPDVTVHFLIPLISRAKARDWDVVCANLRATLDALHRQSSGAWTATIACQDRPDGIVFDAEHGVSAHALRGGLPELVGGASGGSAPRLRRPPGYLEPKEGAGRLSVVGGGDRGRVRFLCTALPEDPRLIDKSVKLRLMVRDLARRGRGDGYVFFLDADDIPHPDLVAFITDDNNGHGYYLGRGYLVDRQADRAVPYGFGAQAEAPFYRINGSVTAIRFDLRRDTRPARAARANPVYPALLRGPHMTSHIRLRAFGLDLAPVPFAAMLYVFNHGDNLETHRGKDHAKVATLGAARTGGFAPVAREFGLA